MTRDDALKICKSHIHFGAKGDDDPGKIIDLAGERTVDMFVALGMLKLDEPKSAEIDITRRLLNACGGVPYLATCINETIAKAGLKLTAA